VDARVSAGADAGADVSAGAIHSNTGVRTVVVVKGSNGGGLGIQLGDMPSKDEGMVRVFRQKFTLEEAIGSHAFLSEVHSLTS
jgi:hypothetical protein